MREPSALRGLVGGRPDGEASREPGPFADEVDAAAAVRRCAALLVPLDGPELQDALLLLVVAKCLDETSGADPRVVCRDAARGRMGLNARGRAIEGLEAALDHASRWLAHVTHEEGWPRLALPRRTAACLASEIGSWAIFDTARAPGGEAVLRSMFAAVAEPTGRLDPASAFVRPGPATALLDAVGFKTRAASTRVVTVAGTKSFGELAALKRRNLDWMRGNYKKGELQLTNFPKLIHVELSTHCNLACRTCSITRPGRNRELTYLSMETLERLRPALPFISDCKLHGGGEPFMHPNIERVLEVFRDEGVRLNTVTNATLIRDRLGHLIGETFSSLTISVDGADKETYEYVRVGATWERLLRGIGFVNRYRNPDLRLIIGVVLLRCNIHQLADFVRFAEAHGAQELQAAWLVPFHDLPWTHTQSLTDDPARTNGFLDEARAVGDELGISVRIPDNLPVLDAVSVGLPTRAQPIVLHQHERGADRAGAEASTIVALDHEATYWDLHGTDRVEGHCRLMYDRAMILVDGSVKPCGQSRTVRQLGSIHDRSFEACWNGDGYQDLRRTFNSGTLPKTCRSCNFIRSKQLGTARLVY